jgi:hypothetical protein
MKHPTKKEEKALQELLDSFDWFFGVKRLEREIVYKKEDEGMKSAEIKYEEDYQRITLYLYPCFWEGDLKERRKTILHEYCHIITIPSKVGMRELLDGKLITYDRIQEINERETSQIENVIDCLLQKHADYLSKSYKNYLNEKETLKKTSRRNMETY